jgi:hypothetical protein
MRMMCVCVCVYFTAVARVKHGFYHSLLGQRPPGGEPWASKTITDRLFTRNRLLQRT